MFNWLFKNKKQKAEKQESQPKPIKTSWTREEIVAEAKRMDSPELGCYTYHPQIWATWIIRADRYIQELEEENTDLKKRLEEYKQEFASYRL